MYIINVRLWYLLHTKSTFILFQIRSIENLLHFCLDTFEGTTVVLTCPEPPPNLKAIHKCCPKNQYLRREIGKATSGHPCTPISGHENGTIPLNGYLEKPEKMLKYMNDKFVNEVNICHTYIIYVLCIVGTTYNTC